MTDYYETKSQPINRLMVAKAYKEVKANKGGAGIDEMSWADLDKDLSKQLYKLWNRMSSGSYLPPLVKEVEIKKKDGGIRKLGVPTILDRIAQQVVKAHLEPLVEPYFHKSSFGYRLRMNAHQAIDAAYHNCNWFDWAIDLDIKAFFDSINHELMMKAVIRFCKDKWVLLYVERWLKAGVMHRDGTTTDRESGTPQGGVISPLLANIYLHFAFDKWMEINHPEKPFERYADDIVIHCKTERQAQYLNKEVEKRLASCKLTVHPVKTKIVNLRGKSEREYPRKFDFLGYTFLPTWVKTKVGFKVMIAPRMSEVSRKSFTQKIQKLHIHKWRKPIEVIAETLQPILRGVINYYCKFYHWKTGKVWWELNEKLLKWVRWEKRLTRRKAIKWLRLKWKEKPNLFPHWALVHP
jgi:RNA-directed DNA polymerase